MTRQAALPYNPDAVDIWELRRNDPLNKAPTRDGYRRRLVPLRNCPKDIPDRQEG